MIALLSPAKTLDLDGPMPAVESTRPRFEAEAASLARSAARLSQRRLRELMGVSAELAKLNADRFRDFAGAAERPAIFTFAGDVYRGLDATSLDAGGAGRAQRRLRLLSGLYGLLRPLDAIRPYRLEMGVRWAPRRDRLTDWWGGRVADALVADLDEAGGTTVVNLASQEYFAAVEGRLPPRVRLVHVEFREGVDRRVVGVHAKHARGLMARWIVDRDVRDPEALRGFEAAAYRLDIASGGPDRLVFVR